MAPMQRSKLRQSAQRWKHKAIQRGTVLKHLKKRLKELKASRNHWKRKALDRQAKITALQRENRQLRQRVTVAQKKSSPAPVGIPTAS